MTYTNTCPETPTGDHSFVRSIKSGRVFCNRCGERRERVAAPQRISARQELADLANLLNVGHDWHEPDEVEVTAKVFGRSFDNAGTWPIDNDSAATHVDSEALEMYVEISKDGRPVAIVNLATLFAFACGTYEG